MELSRSIRSHRVQICCLLLALSLILHALCSLLGVQSSAEELSKAGMSYEIDHVLFFWIGYQRAVPFSPHVSVLPFGYLSMYLVLVFPVLLAFLNADLLTADKRAGLCPALIARSGSLTYIWRKGIFVLISSVVLSIIMLLVQLLCSVMLLESMTSRNTVVQTTAALVLVEGFVKVPLYFGSLEFLAFAVSLFLPDIIVIPYILPCVFSLLGIMGSIAITGNSAYYSMFFINELAHTDEYWFWWEIGIKLAFSAGLITLWGIQRKRRGIL